MSRKVVVTGIGIVSPLGIGAPAFASAMLAGASGARPSPVSARGIPVPALAATLGDLGLKIQETVSPRYLRRLPGISRWSVGAAVEAASGPAAPDGATAGLLEDTAVVLGTSFGASSYHFEYYEKLFRNGIRDASPLLFSESVMNAASGHVAIVLKLRGPSLALVGGEEVGLAAILDAHDRIRMGECAAALAGGAEEYCDFVHASLAAKGRVASEPGEAYTDSSRGTILAEGAAFLRLEGEERGVTALARLAGTGMARSLEGDAGLPDSIARAVAEALAMAGIGPESLGLVVTSASGNHLDGLEAQGLARALGPGVSSREVLPVCAPLTSLGEGFAFTSAAQAVVAVQALASGSIPPSRSMSRTNRLPAGFRIVLEPETLRGAHVLVVSKSSRGNAVAALLDRA